MTLEITERDVKNAGAAPTRDQKLAAHREDSRLIRGQIGDPFEYAEAWLNELFEPEFFAHCLDEYFTGGER